MSTITTEQSEILTTLANAVIPADEADGGAAEVDAGAALSARVENGVLAALYTQGIDAAAALAHERFGCGFNRLNAEQVYNVLMGLKTVAPRFYKQLRLDVSALYLSDPAVQLRIGFPGPSSESGGYPDFDQPQRK